MKYTIVINQVGIVRAGLHDKTDLVDWAIIDYLRDWFFSGYAKKVAFTNPEAGTHTDYVWVNYNHMLKQLPMIGIRDKDAISKRFKKLKQLGLIDTQKLGDNTLYFILTPYCIETCYHREVEDEQPKNEITEKQIPILSPSDRAILSPSDRAILSPSDSTSSISLSRVSTSRKNKDIAQSKKIARENEPTFSQPTSPSNKFDDSNFKEFWEKYPRKVGKPAAMKAFKKVNIDTKSIKDMLTALKIHTKSRQWQDKGYIPHPATWLTQRRWEDEVTIVEPRYLGEDEEIII